MSAKRENDAVPPDGTDVDLDEILQSQAIEEPAVNAESTQVDPVPATPVISKIPRGLEVLVKKASVDPKFRALLLADPSAAARSIDLALTPNEEAMLGAVTREQMTAIIDATVVPESHRRTFLGTASAAMLLAIGGLTGFAFLGAEASRGSRPDHPIGSSSVSSVTSYHAYCLREATADAMGVRAYDEKQFEPFGSEEFDEAAQLKFQAKVAKGYGLEIYIPLARVQQWTSVKDATDYVDLAVLAQRPVILQVAKTAGIWPSDALIEKSLVDDLKLDVAQRAEIHQQLAKSLGQSISWDEFKELQTVDDVVLYVGDLMQQAVR